MINKKTIYTIIGFLAIIAIGCAIIYSQNNKKTAGNDQNTVVKDASEAKNSNSKTETSSGNTAKSEKESSKKVDVKDTSVEVQGITGDGDILLKTSYADLKEAGFEPGDLVSVHVEDKGDYLEIPYSTSYDPDGETSLIAFEGKESSVISNPKEDLSEDDNWSGISAVISLDEKGGRMDVVPSANNSGDNDIWQYSASREDYDSDEQFANAREVVLGDIKSGRLYRSASIFCNKCN